MGNLTRRDLVVKVAMKTGLPQQEVAKVFEEILDVFMEVFKKKETIELRNFGVFEVTLRKARIGRNPRNPERDILIPQELWFDLNQEKKLKAFSMRLQKISLKRKN
ncbi:HU family DNA-binding protein [Methylacidiphilum kamchatkense]|uniref:DNA-binding protein HU-beta/integration host factor subunit alpha n=1 Tax=Methylacidiphilum kamchatkense Kam1 TaxID=1202785 RepID=A0A516TJA3_9BACT|nr:HU family DNA-binding protein [Methylacidiphilum kamchatkense]QDQ41338.1 DNA-binding protein HU-beta/integration host factor subunit alpha [Methylacidiphilum kamchatkense Kam1]